MRFDESWRGFGRALCGLYHEGSFLGGRQIYFRANVWYWRIPWCSCFWDTFPGLQESTLLKFACYLWLSRVCVTGALPWYISGLCMRRQRARCVSTHVHDGSRQLAPLFLVIASVPSFSTTMAAMRKAMKAMKVRRGLGPRRRQLQVTMLQ